MSWVRKYIIYTFYQQQNILKAMRYVLVNVIYFTSAGFKLVMYCLKMAL
jgi:hypothetical protein